LLRRLFSGNLSFARQSVTERQGGAWQTRARLRASVSSAFRVHLRAAPPADGMTWRRSSTSSRAERRRHCGDVAGVGPHGRREPHHARSADAAR
jgi:hypothetical protein